MLENRIFASDLRCCYGQTAFRPEPERKPTLTRGIKAKILRLRPQFHNMDFEETNAKLISHEFLAVVLAGFGNEYARATYFTVIIFDRPFQTYSPD